jgi:hypothetical protein
VIKVVGGKIQVFEGKCFVSLRVYSAAKNEWVVLRLSRSQRDKLVDALKDVQAAP